MKIEYDKKEVIDFKDFGLNWRWDELHNPIITIEEKAQIMPLSIFESKRINKVIDHFEFEVNLFDLFVPTDWFRASYETEKSKQKFTSEFDQLTADFEENIFVSWDRSTCVYTTKRIFLRYWDDFCYPSSDNVTIISEKTNWVFFFNHVEVGKFWRRKSEQVFFDSKDFKV